MSDLELGAHRLGLFLDIALWAVPMGILGGRFFHVLTHPNDYFYQGADLLDIFKNLGGRPSNLWRADPRCSGSVHWFASCWSEIPIGCRRGGSRILLAQGIGRLGNYFNQELFGLPTTLPWGLAIPSSNPAYPIGLQDGLTFHPILPTKCSGT